MTKFVRLLVGLIPWAVACSGASDSTVMAGEGPYYTKTCVRTLCDECRDEVSAACSECIDVCRYSTDSTCQSTCTDICRSDCSVCSHPTSCAAWQVSLPKPAPDDALNAKCVAHARACFPDHDESTCTFITSLVKPTVGEYYDCRLNNGCTAAECTRPTVTGTLGTDYCARLQQCGEPCSDFDTSWINNIEPDLRPELVASFRHCIAEDTCAAVEACGAAHAALLHGTL